MHVSWIVFHDSFRIALFRSDIFDYFSYDTRRKWCQEDIVPTIMAIAMVWLFLSSLTKLVCQRKWYHGVSDDTCLSTIPQPRTAGWREKTTYIARSARPEPLDFNVHLCLFKIQNRWWWLNERANLLRPHLSGRERRKVRLLSMPSFRPYAFL